MYVYSKFILKFLETQRQAIRDILQKEMQLMTTKTHFSYGYYNYPIQLVLFEDTHKIGYFDPISIEIGLNKCLLYSQNTRAIKNILRHELAHYICFIDHKNTYIKDHGLEFKSICKRFRWGKEVSAASISWQDTEIIYKKNKPNIKIIQKVKKLIALSSSDKKNESEAATMKANELLLKHRLAQDIVEADNSEVCLKRVLYSKRKHAKQQAISHILKTFMVETIYSKSSGTVCIEIIGNRLHVELASYVADFLDIELETQWRSAKQKQSSLRGISQKNNFMMGLAAGYVKRIHTAQEENCDQQGLILLSKKLEEQVHMIHPNVSRAYSKAQYHQEAQEIGKKMGAELQIRAGLSEKKPDSLYTNSLLLKG